MENLIRKCCDELNITLSHDMPAGYEDAYGTFDVCSNTLFLNRAFLWEGEPWRAAFYFFHELRHAQQYRHTAEFPLEIRESLPYVILYNGVCFKLHSGHWTQCTLEGEEAVFTNLYLSLPYELDANRYAYERTAQLYPEAEKKIAKLYQFFLPEKKAGWTELKRVFLEIDQLVRGKGA